MKRIITLLASLALVASGFQIMPAAAADEPTQVPAVVNIEDPLGDANYLNGQGFDDSQGDNVTPADAGSLSDIQKVWFTSDATMINAHIQTEALASGQNVAIFFRVQVDPVGGDPNCLRFQGMTGGLNTPDAPMGSLRDLCGDNDETTSDGVTFKMEEGPDASGIYTISVPRAAHPAFTEGTQLLAPTAHSRNYVGAQPAGGVTAPQVDDTKPGTDFVVSSGEPAVAPPGKKPVPGKKKGCTKGKGKKRGCEGPGKKAPKRGRPSAACAPLTPATAGADAPAVTLTDAATADAPLVQALTLEQKFDEGLTESTPASVNVLVDTASKDPVGLYATLTFPTRRDYDLWAYFPDSDNQEAASSHGFNPLAETQGINDSPDPSNTASNHGGETTADSENLVGILTPDCGGYTISAYNYFGEGGELELTLWLGEVKYDPAETPAAARAAYEAVLAIF